MAVHKKHQFCSKTSLTKDELVDKVKGIIYGTAIGDGVGLATEFMYNKDQVRTLYGNGPIKFGNAEGHPFCRDAFRSRWFENDFTDDTDQMLLILQSILDDNGTINPLNFAFRLKEWTTMGFPELDNKLPSGIGFTVGSTCSHKQVLTNPLRASYDVWNRSNRNLAANGALMRTGIVGAPYFWDESIVVENSMMAAKVTHADPRSVTSSVILSVIISRLLRGSIIQEHDDESPIPAKDVPENLMTYFTEMIEIGTVDESSSYLDKFQNCKKVTAKQRHIPWHRPLLREARRLAGRLTGHVDPLTESDIFDQFNIPNYPKAVDPKRYETPVALRENVKPIDDYGADDAMMELCMDVVDNYSFLLEKNSLCPPDSDRVGELRSHSFPESLSSLKLNERDKIGYTFKCLGAGLYLGTRKIPEGMTCAEFFENLITQLVLEAGDADTNAAVAGALLGCRLGKSRLPKPWVDGLRHRNFLDKIADDLCKMILTSVKGT